MWLCCRQKEKIHVQRTTIGTTIETSKPSHSLSNNIHISSSSTRQKIRLQRPLLVILCTFLLLLIICTVSATEMIKIAPFQGWKHPSSSIRSISHPSSLLETSSYFAAFVANNNSSNNCHDKRRHHDVKKFYPKNLHLSAALALKSQNPGHHHYFPLTIRRRSISCHSTTIHAAYCSSLSFDKNGHRSRNKIITHSTIMDNNDNSSGDVTLDDEDDFTMDNENDHTISIEDKGSAATDLSKKEEEENFDDFEFTTMSFQDSFSSSSSSSDNTNNEESVDVDTPTSSSNKKKRNVDTKKSKRQNLFRYEAQRGWMSIDWDNIDLYKYPPPPKEESTTPTTPTAAFDNANIAKIDELHPVNTPDSPSPVELVVVRDRIVYIKRDDLLHLKRSNASGNKARKFLPLNEMVVGGNGGDDINGEEVEFPDVVVSYGGPQSNAMVAIAAIVHSKNEELAKKYGTFKNSEEEDVSGGLDILDFESLSSEGNEDHDDNDEEELLSTDEAAAILELNEELDSQQQQQNQPSSPPSKQHSYQKNTKKYRFVYYTKKIPRYLRKQPNGNLLRAMSLGMEIVELTNARYSELFGGEYGGSPIAPKDIVAPVPGRSLWIPQGGACGVAVPGAKLLAKEIVEFWANQGRDVPLSVCVPGGTCTTAMLLHREMNILLRQRENEDEPKLDIQVVAIPCVGDDTYALRQMMALDENTGGTGLFDDTSLILRPHPDGNYGTSRRRLGGYFVFGEPAAAILQTFQEMKEDHGVFLDLLYGAPAWSLLLQHWRATPSTGVGKALRGKRYIDDSCPIAGRQVMYVHSGGQEGISSQLTRYKHKGLIDSSELQ